MLPSVYDVLVMYSTVRDRVVTKFGVMHRLVGKLLCPGTLEIWRKERRAILREAQIGVDDFLGAR